MNCFLWVQELIQKNNISLEFKNLHILSKMQLQQIQSKIFELRGIKVMLDSDLAELYETETKRLKEAVRRNIDRSPLILCLN
jgi:hypothetical protein